MKDRQKALDACIDYLEKVIDAVKEIKDGIPESVVCKKYGIDKNFFRRMLFNQSLGYSEEKPTNPIEYLMLPEERLYCDVFEIRSLDGIEVPLDLAESVRYVCEKLGKRYKKIIFYRYWKGLTLQEIGNRLGVCKERIRQILEKILCKLRFPAYANVLRFGLKYVRQRQNIEKARTTKTISSVVERLQQECMDVIARNDVEAVKQCRAKCNIFLEEHPIITNESVGEVPLTEIELSTRSRCALQSNGITKVKELAKFKTTGDLLTIRNLGKLSVEEIREKAVFYGIVIKKSNRITI